jgi:putative protease
MALSALESGADSVYIGPKGWSRRPSEDELSDAEMREVIEYAVDAGKEARVAINVMPCPDEIPMFLSKVERYLALGAAGVMICDPGCIRLVRERFPSADIHVSVTAGIFNIEDIRFYREMGANLVILPYRWGSAEIEEIRTEAKVGLEAFLFQTPHRGWICPGRCCSSSYFQIHRWLDEEGKDHCIGSAGRGGSCHRICRARWELTIAESPSPVRPRLKSSPDLLLFEVPRYVRMGVVCFKIPGRERSTDLVCAIVRLYRRVLDHVLAGGGVEPFVPEWEELKERWLAERVGRDETRLQHAQGIPAHRILRGSPANAGTLYG